ncbi:NUDIX hydrolase [Salinibacillus xinjiangensis]|uniref:NUDIX domain-containing protein n=1 Tax=Salinibacillus xinjiangensis TaxID=1229268 RepID=A0A6G1X2N9_9BACI|nr:NUDIX hydrolase [Salinibacillus xinjiangensis]MRG85241.1 NUDIX domain-containing protein [Salinibacillus xinjiangensis]
MTAIPKPAATVVLMDDESKVYLTQRPKTMKFLGGYFVFPGGSIDEEDYSFLIDYIKYDPPSNHISLEYYIAAARELFEEVGVLLIDTGGEPPVFQHQSAEEYRMQLINNEISLLNMLEAEDFRLDLHDLQYFGHRITPKTSPIRFDTRFFIAKLPKGQSPKPDQNEITEAYWTTPEDALYAYEKGELSMVPPTIVSLRTIANYVNKGGSLMMPDRENESSI